MPIQALSATCPPRVQDDIIKILKLKPMVDGTAARPNRTSHSAPMPPARDVKHWSPHALETWTADHCTYGAGTVFFSSPLYRKNLHYTVLQKPSAKAAVFKTIADWITSNHPRDSGIVYCLTVKVGASTCKGV